MSTKISIGSSGAHAWALIVIRKYVQQLNLSADLSRKPERVYEMKQKKKQYYKLTLAVSVGAVKLPELARNVAIMSANPPDVSVPSR